MSPNLIFKQLSSCHLPTFQTSDFWKILLNQHSLLFHNINVSITLKCPLIFLLMFLMKVCCFQYNYFFLVNHRLLCWKKIILIINFSQTQNVDLPLKSYFLLNSIYKKKMLIKLSLILPINVYFFKENNYLTIVLTGRVGIS